MTGDLAAGMLLGGLAVVIRFWVVARLTELRRLSRGVRFVPGYDYRVGRPCLQCECPGMMSRG